MSLVSHFFLFSINLYLFQNPIHSVILEQIYMVDDKKMDSKFSVLISLNSINKSY